ncbi:MAG: hypothetical protein AAGH76_08580 [Pseudomonadota bacterium]
MTTTELTAEQRRRNRTSAILLGLVAVGFFVAFVVAVSLRSGA